MNTDQPILVLAAGHIVNLSRCNYVRLDDSTITVEYPEESLDIEFDSEEEAAAAMVSMTNQLAAKGALISAVAT
jgi:hypothetical protein